jgi:RNA polymerase sigma-70 factor (ECF subfamily)
MPEPTDRDLLLRLPEDRGAFEQFYRRNVSTVTRFAARRCRTAADVADVVSGTFLAVQDSADKFDPRRGSPTAWLLGIAAHEISAVHRREDRERGTATRIAGRALLDDDDNERLEARITAEQLAPAISVALAAAPPAEREVFLLVAYDELTPTEAARVLGITPVAARVRLSRVRRRLRQTRQGTSPPPFSPASDMESTA